MRERGGMMTRYDVQIADRDTGEVAVHRVDAPTAMAAERQASALGVVGQITEHAEVDAPSALGVRPITEHVEAPRRLPLHRLYEDRRTQDPSRLMNRPIETIAIGVMIGVVCGLWLFAISFAGIFVVLFGAALGGRG